MRICFENVSCWRNKVAADERPVLNHLSIDIPSGQFVALLGPSGSGKTTFAQIIGALLFPDAGQVTVGTFRISKKSKDLHLLREKIGFVFQHPEQQLLGDTVEEDIALGLTRYYPTGSTDLDSCVKDMMERIDLPFEALRGRSPFRLSLGQMRLVAFAGALITEPEILLLDDAATGLDPVRRLNVLDCVKHLHETRETTVVYITHHLEDALEFAERIVVLEQGAVTADMPPSAVPDLLSDLHEAGIFTTPLLRFAERLEQKIPGLLSHRIVKERAFFSQLIRQLRPED